MNCNTSYDCGGCNKLGSEAMCVNGGCVCSLPQKSLRCALRAALVFATVFLVLKGMRRDDFIPSSKWKGERRGYAFKLGDKGQGYYVLIPAR